MSDPLEALESLVEELRKGGSTWVAADELEPIIQQLKEAWAKKEQTVEWIADERAATVSALRFSEREWRNKAQDKIAEVERLEERSTVRAFDKVWAERERYREALEAIADIGLNAGDPSTQAPTIARTALREVHVLAHADGSVSAMDGGPAPAAPNGSDVVVHHPAACVECGIVGHPHVHTQEEPS